MFFHFFQLKLYSVFCVVLGLPGCWEHECRGQLPGKGVWLQRFCVWCESEVQDLCLILCFCCLVSESHGRCTDSSRGNVKVGKMEIFLLLPFPIYIVSSAWSPTSQNLPWRFTHCWAAVPALPVNNFSEFLWSGSRWNFPNRSLPCSGLRTESHWQV